MSDYKIDIVPTVTVHEMLEAYPDLEDVLIGIAPPFKKLKNPILRRSVAKVATLKHVASVGKVPLNELVGKLRQAVGQPPIKSSFQDEEYFQPKPDWFSQEKIAVTIDEGSLEDEDKMTLVAILTAAKGLSSGEIIELVTNFLPAPGIDIWKAKSNKFWSTKGEGEQIKTYFLK